MISISAVLQILILYLVIYTILKGARGSRFGQALMGFGILAALLIAFSYLLHFEVLARIVQFLLVYIAVSTVVIFQPESRRILSAVGAFGYLERPKYTPEGAATPELVTETILALAEKRMGALFAFERGISLRGYEDTGVQLNATFSRELATCVFTPPLPLHDGGVVIRDGHLASAHCIFPTSNNPALISNGMRHRAAVGLSEETDAFVVVVSEESGAISIARNGKLTRLADEGRDALLLRWISRAMPHANPSRSTLGRLWAGVRNRLPGFMKGNSK